MKHDGRITGLPLVSYADTKDSITALALAAADAGAWAYATDTAEVGVYDGAAWAWMAVQDYLATADIDTLAELNAIITDATLDDSGDPRPPTDHIHVNAPGEGGAVSHTNLDNIEADDHHDAFTAADHTAIGDGAPHHAAATLDANADALLSLSGQQVGLDTQAANTVLAGPAAAPDAVPTFRAMVAADLPAIAHADTTLRDAANSHPASAIREAVTIGRVMQSNAGTGDLEAATLVKSGAGVLTLEAAAAYTATVLATGDVALGAGTLTAATANDVTGATHTHAITTTSDAETTVSTILAGDANGALRLARLGVGAAAPGIDGTADIGGLISTPRIANTVLEISRNVDGVSGVNMQNTSSGTNADFRFLIQDDTDNEYISFTMPSSNNTGILFGQTRSDITGLFSVALSGGSARNLVLGTFNSASVILGTANSERVRINGSGNLLIGTTTDGMTANGSLAIAQDLAHRGTKVGFYNKTPVTQPAVPVYTAVQTTQAAGATYTANEQTMLANLKTDVTNLRAAIVALTNKLDQTGAAVGLLSGTAT